MGDSGQIRKEAENMRTRHSADAWRAGNYSGELIDLMARAREEI